MYKKHSLILLPTDEANNALYKNKNGRQLNYHPGYLTQDYLKVFLNAESFHLCILSDDKPLKNNWILDIKNPKKPRQIKTEHLLEDLFETEKKIIATTNTSLKIEGELNRYNSNDKYLAQIPFLFIQHYIEQYNLGNVITEVEVEYEYLYWGCDKPFNTWNERASYLSTIFDIPAISIKETENLKLNTNNTINIKPLKNNWTRKEVIALLNLAMATASAVSMSTQKEADEWIENNL